MPDTALAVDLTFQNDDVDLWSLYERHHVGIDVKIVAAVNECLGPDFHAAVFAQPGSLVTRLVITIKRAWKPNGQRNPDATGEESVSVSELERKLHRVVEQAVAVVKPVTVGVTATFKVLSPVVMLFSASVSLLENLGLLPPGGGAAIRAIAPRPSFGA